MARKHRKPRNEGGHRDRPTRAHPSSLFRQGQPARAHRENTIRKVLGIALSSAGLVLAVGLLYQLLMKKPPQHEPSGEQKAATFVGSETCAGCHQSQAQSWRGSHHRHAMDHATEQSVLGDFSNASVEYFGVRSRFFRSGNKFLVETDDAAGKLATFEIKYTFGLEPLQQYLIEFPDGRLQALSIAWDSRTREAGGQRWFHLYPNEEIRHDNVLHWTKLNQNWNFMCAECHSTGVRKKYDVDADRFATTFAEISIGCEGCHGQGSAHVAWARRADKPNAGSQAVGLHSLLFIPPPWSYDLDVPPASSNQSRNAISCGSVARALG